MSLYLMYICISIYQGLFVVISILKIIINVSLCSFCNSMTTAHGWLPRRVFFLEEVWCLEGIPRRTVQWN